MKQIKNYAIFWIVLVGLFNLICFVTPSEWDGVSRYSDAFWVGYSVVMASYLLHFVYACFAFSGKRKEKQFLNTPLTIISFFELGLMIVVGALCVMLPTLPYWLGIIICYITLTFSIILLFSAQIVGENTIEANRTLNSKTVFMRELTDTAQELVSSARTEETREIVIKVYEAIKYSDMISSDETKDAEFAIAEGLKGIRDSINNCDLKETQKKADQVIQLIEKRNNKCKAGKRQI